MLETALLVMDHIDAMVAYWDKDCICHFANNAYKSWFGKRRDEIIGRHIKELLGPELYQKNLTFITEALKGNLQVFEREIPLPEGGSRHSLATYTPHIVSGEVKGFFVLVADSTHLKRIEKELLEEKNKVEALATHDFLTGLPNRVLLYDRINKEIAATKRYKKGFSVFCMDLDKFKNINDTYGHDVGDILLQQIALRLNRIVREVDTVARLGGDEFVILAPQVSSIKDAQVIASKILNEVSRPYSLLNNTIEIISFSIGIAFYPQNGETMNELLKNSDKAMYKAKQKGHNRFEFLD